MINIIIITNTKRYRDAIFQNSLKNNKDKLRYSNFIELQHLIFL
jgi:hypothetical protein